MGDLMGWHSLKSTQNQKYILCRHTNNIKERIEEAANCKAVYLPMFSLLNDKEK